MGNMFYCCCWEDEDDSMGGDAYRRGGGAGIGGTVAAAGRNAAIYHHAPWWRRTTHTMHDGTSSGTAASAGAGGVPLLHDDQHHVRNNSPENSSSAAAFMPSGRKGSLDELFISSLQASLVPRSLEEERSYMVRSMSSSLMELKEPECLFCLDGFSEQDPSVKSLCGCGENKSPMHRRCLEEWRTKSTSCPACGETLFYEVASDQHSPLLPSQTVTPATSAVVTATATAT
jgi:hypothetical protein